MNRIVLSAAGAASLICAAPALAQTRAPGPVAVAGTFPGLMYEAPPVDLDDGTGTVCKAPIAPLPMALHHVRPMNLYCGFVKYPVPFKTSSWNPSPGVYRLGPIHKFMDYFKSKNVAVEYTTNKDVEPAPITFDSSVRANVEALDTATRYLNTDLVKRGTPFVHWQPANEPTDKTNYWASSLQDLAAFYCTQAVAVKATSPTTEIVDPGFTPTGNGSAGAGLPTSYAHSLDRFIRLRQARCPGARPKWIDVHGYVPAVVGSLTTAASRGSPELMYGALNTVVALYRSLGETDLKLQVGEGFVRGNRSFDNLNAAGDQAAQIVLLSSYYNKGLQVTWYNHEGYSWRQTSDVARLQNSYTDMAFTPDGLNMSGRMVKFWFGQLAGAKWITPMARVTRANLIRTPPTQANAAQFRPGKLSGPATPPANCPANLPAGTATLPSTWNATNPSSAAGVAMYSYGLTTDSEGVTGLDIVGCGADTTPGTGVKTQQIIIETGIKPAANAGYVFGENIAMPAGDFTNLQWIEIKVDDQTYRNYASQLMLYPVNRPVSESRQEARLITRADTATMHFQNQVTYYYNGSNPKPIDWRLRIALPTLEQGPAIWSGVLQTADGQVHCVAMVEGEEDNGTAYTLPSQCASHTHWTDGITGDHTTPAGHVTLTSTPMITGTSAQTARFAAPARR